MEAPYDDLARQIGEAAWRVTDAQVASVLAAAGSEKATFEVIAAAATGAGLPRWQRPGFAVVRQTRGISLISQWLAADGFWACA